MQHGVDLPFCGHFGLPSKLVRGAKGSRCVACHVSTGQFRGKLAPTHTGKVAPLVSDWFHLVGDGLPSSLPFYPDTIGAPTRSHFPFLMADQGDAGDTRRLHGTHGMGGHPLQSTLCRLGKC